MLDDLYGSLEDDIEAEVPVALGEEDVAHLHRLEMPPRHEASQVSPAQYRKGHIVVVRHSEHLLSLPSYPPYPPYPPYTPSQPATFPPLNPV